MRQIYTADESKFSAAESTAAEQDGIAEAASNDLSNNSGIQQECCTAQTRARWVR